ncbi:MAG: hypothetical protein Q9169_001646 [Polycauliona sp. 2 TL-2023]
MNSKRRQLDSTSPSKTAGKSAKRQQTRHNSDLGPGSGNTRPTLRDPSEQSSSMELKDGFWGSDTVLNELLHDPSDAHVEKPQNRDYSLGESIGGLPSVFPIPKAPGTLPQSATAAMSFMANDSLDGFLLTPPSTANPTTTPAEPSEHPSQSCGCIRSLTGILQKIGGDGGSDTDETDRFDFLLMHLRDGVKICKHVLPCKQCCIPSTNSMFIVTIVQQLATISQDLCLQLLDYQRVVKTTGTTTTTTTSTATATADVPPPPPSPPPLLLHTADFYVGKYQIQTPKLRLGFLFPIVRLYLQDLNLLLERLRGHIRKGTKACRLLGVAAEVVQTAMGDWQMALNGQKIGTRRATF